MRRLLKSFKTEIDPSEEQVVKIRKTIGTCRYIYNFFIAQNKEWYREGKKYLGYQKFSVWLNREYLPGHPEYSWIKEVSSKSVKRSLEHADRAFRKFFKKEAGFPKLKKKSHSDVKMYFVKTDKKATIWCERHRIKIPTIGWVKIKEKGYIPTTESGYVIKSGSVSERAGRFYISVLVEVPDENASACENDGIGIDIGIKDLAILSDGRTFRNINKTGKIRKLEKKLRREQRQLSRKYENKKKGNTQNKNIRKQLLKVQKVHQRLEQIRSDHINKTVNEIVKTKPSYIVLEDLNIAGMMKNKHLSKAVATQKLYEFQTKLKCKCKQNGIEFRQVDRWYPSSKTCHCCGKIKKDLKLSDRVYRCSCGYEADRDYNASLNLRDATAYKVA